MDEKTLLAEKIKEEKVKKESIEQIEEKYIQQKGYIPSNSTKKQFDTIKKSKEFTINPFSSSAFKNVQSQVNIEKETVQKQEAISASSSSIIEPPNYDFIDTLSPEQRQKIFKEEAVEDKVDAKAKPNKFKIIMFSILFAIFGVWGIVNIAMLDNLSSQISNITTEYNMNLISYLNNLHNLDATNSENMENLFETIPKDEFPANSIASP